MPWNRPSSQPDQLGLGDAQLGVARGDAVLERQGHRPQLVLEVGRQRAGQLVDRALVDGGQPLPAGVVERRGSHLVEQLLHHRADPHHLGRLADHLHRLGLGWRCRGRPPRPRGVRPRPLASRRATCASPCPSSPAPRPASSGTNISAAVSEPCRQTSGSGPVSAGSSKLTRRGRRGRRRRAGRRRGRR